MAEETERKPTLTELARRRPKMGAIMDWGTGESNDSRVVRVPHAIQRIGTLTRRHLIIHGIPIEEAHDWAYGYLKEAQRDDVYNPSALPRAQLMECAAKLLESQNEDATGLDCCAEELRWPPSDAGAQAE